MYKFLIIAGLCFVTYTTWGKTVFVSTNGSAIPPYNSWATAATDIQVAIDYSISGDTVLVNDGIYSPSAEILISNNITVASLNGAELTTVSGGNSHRCFKLINPDCEISGFTITKGYSAANGGGVYCNNLNATIANCKIYKNISNANGGGIYNGTANSCLITHNTASLNGGGVSGSYLNNCTVCKNYAYDSGGGMSYGRSRNSIVWYNEAAANGNNFNSNHTITAYSCSPQLEHGVNGCITNYPQFSDVENENFHLLRTSPCYDTGNNSYVEGSSDFDGNARIVGGIVDMGAYELADNSVHIGSPVHYVSMTGASIWPYTNWSSAARSIQDAVDVAEAGDVVRVNDGFYNSGGALNYGLSRILVDKSITIESVNGPENTIVAGAADPVNAMDEAAIRGAYFSSNVVFSGFTVTNGHSQANNLGGGIYCPDYSSLISNCIVVGNISSNHAGGVCRGKVTASIISYNTTYNNGGGIYRSVISDSIISFNSGVNGGGIYLGSGSNCTFYGNSGYNGGGAYHTTISDCILNCNTSYYGGAIYGGTINDSLVVSNLAYLSGGGMSGGTAINSVFRDNVSYVNGGGFSETTINNCKITGNHANKYGGGMFKGTANNCVINDNWASYDGGGAATGILNNCTVIDNRANGVGGGVSGGEIRNSIIWYNHASTSGNNINSLTASIYSCSPDIVNGVNGCITNYPQFSDVENENFHLLRTSPCYDTGNNSYVEGSSDFDGNARIVGGIVDMGAYELAYNSAHIGSPVHYVSMTGASIWPYTNWSSAARSIQDAVDVAESGDTIQINDGFYNSGGLNNTNGASRISTSKAITIKSVNGAEYTVIAGAADTNKFGKASVRCVSISGNASISGLTLTGGYGSSGGGVLCASTNNIVSSCIITNNSVAESGGGMCNGTLNNSFVYDNEATLNGGGLDHVDANNCIISNNIAEYDGGGVSYGTVNDSVITKNSSHRYGGGMVAGTANRSVVANNFATSFGGGTYVVTANNCLIKSNTSLAKGGGMRGGSADNCVVYGNNSSDDGGGIYGLTSVKNSIITGNTGPYHKNISTCSSVTYSCSTADDLTGAGVGCITNNPLFIADGTDFHLQSNSPCIDAGSVTGLANDLDGISRPLDGNADGTATTDIGVYEFSNPSSDSDGDSVSDYDEMVADTDATDNSDYFQVTAVSNGLQTTVYFESSNKRIYTLQGCTNLFNAIWHNISDEINKPGDGSTYSMHDTDNISHKYYRVVVEIP